MSQLDLRPTPVLFGAALLLMGCPPAEQVPVDSEQELIDTGPHVYTGFTGEFTYLTTFGDETECDLRIGLVGTPYTGECEGCDFAFDLEATILEDNSIGGCTPSPFTTWLEGPYYHHYEYALEDPAMAYLPNTEDYSQLFLSSFRWSVVDGEETEYLGRYWFPIAYAGSPYGVFIRDGDDVSWSWFQYIADDSRTAYLDADTLCLVDDDSASALEEAGFTATSELGCDPELVDVWSVEGVEGETVTVTVDTVSDETALDLVAWINDTANETCVVAYSDDDHACSFPPPDYGCPTLAFEAQSGTFEVVVASYGTCAGETAEYKVLIDSETTVTAELTIDDVAVVIEGASARDILGSGTLTWE